MPPYQAPQFQPLPQPLSQPQVQSIPPVAVAPASLEVEQPKIKQIIKVVAHQLSLLITIILANVISFFLFLVVWGNLDRF